MRRINWLLTAAAVLAAVGLSGCGGEEPVEEPNDGGVTDTTGSGGDNNNGGYSGNYDISLSCGNRPCGNALMPDGKVWMTENLNYQTADSWCWGDSAANCETYGRLYTWEAAKKACPAGYHLPSNQDWGGLAEAVGGNKVLRTLFDDYFIWEWEGASEKLKSRGWGGGMAKTIADDFGFSALPGGYRVNYYSGDFPHPLCSGDINDEDDCSGVSFQGIGQQGIWWTATEYSEKNAYGYWMSIDGVDVFEGYDPGGNGFSVRCIADK